MTREYSFTLTVPLAELAAAEELLQQAGGRTPAMRLSRKPDRKDTARFYLSFPFCSTRPDLAFQRWFSGQMRPNWDLFGPTHGRWGLTSQHD